MKKEKARKVMISMDDNIYRHFMNISPQERSAFIRECLALRWALEECNLLDSVIKTLQRDAELRNAEDDLRFYEILQESMDKRNGKAESKALKGVVSTEKVGEMTEKQRSKADATRREIEKYRAELERLENKSEQKDELSELKGKVRKLKWEQTKDSLGVVGDLGKKASDWATMKGVSDEEKKRKIHNIDEMLGKLYGEDDSDVGHGDEHDEISFLDEQVTPKRKKPTRKLKPKSRKRRQPDEEDDEEDETQLPFDPYAI